MTNSNFLRKLHNEGKLELVEPSEDIAAGYVRKAEDSLKAAQLLYKNGLWENSVAMAYYAMYNSVQAVLFRAGIKCENHAAAIQLLRDVIGQPKLHDIIAAAKKERIDKQYYVTYESTKESATDLVQQAEPFLVQAKRALLELRQDSIEQMRKRAQEMIS